MNTITATSRFEHLPFTISPDENLIVVTAKGSLHFDDLISHVPEFMAHPDFRSGMNLIYDFTNVDTVDGDLTVLMESVESLDDENFIPVPARTVFVIRDNNHIKGFFEGFCIMTRYTRIPHFMAETLEEAHTLLKMNQ